LLYPNRGIHIMKENDSLNTAMNIVDERPITLLNRDIVLNHGLTLGAIGVYGCIVSLNKRNIHIEDLLPYSKEGIEDILPLWNELVEKGLLVEED
jgi:hypothetical protein